MTTDNSLVRKITMTISIPLPLYVWLKQTQRNASAYVVQAIEAMRPTQDNEGGHEHEDN